MALNGWLISSDHSEASVVQVTGQSSISFGVCVTVHVMVQSNPDTWASSHIVVGLFTLGEEVACQTTDVMFFPKFAHRLC